MTPAENVNVTTNTVINHVGKSNYPGGYNFSIPYVVPSFWKVKTRPASSSSHKNRETGWRDCKPWQHYGHQVKKGGGDYSYRRRWPDGSEDSQTWTGGGLWNYSPQGAPAFPSNLKNRVTVEALNKLKFQDIHLGNYFVEGRQTVRMVGDAFHVIARTIFNFRRRFPELWEAVKQYEVGRLPCDMWHLIPKAWLQIQYGWTPLLKDIYGALQHLDRTGKTVGQMVHVSSKRTDYEKIIRVLDARQWAVTARTETKVKYFAQCSLWYRLNNPEQAELSSLGLINPTEWAWEAVPWSFVLDWAVPVGAYISSLSADVGWSFSGGSVSMLTKWQERGLDCTHISGSVPGGHTFWTEGGPPTITAEECFKFERECLSSSPVPGIYYKNPISAKHVANGLALMATALFGSGRR